MKPTKDLYAAMMLPPARPSLARKADKDASALSKKDIKLSEEMFSRKKPKKMAGGGLYENIHAKRKRISEGSGEKMRKPGSPGAPTAKAFKRSAKTAKGK
jgi:hypothetical protein